MLNAKYLSIKYSMPGTYFPSLTIKYSMPGAYFPSAKQFSSLLYRYVAKCRFYHMFMKKEMNNLYS